MRKFASMLLLLMLSSFLALAQSKITGKVSDKGGLPVENASVVIKNTSRGTVTNAAGVFTISVKKGETLVITALSYKTAEVVIKNDESLTISMETSESVMDEVIVTAGGLKTKRREQGTAGTVLKGDVITAGKALNVASGLQGKVAGLQISATGGGVNPNYRLILRGQRSLTGNNQALIVLDNVIVPNEVLGNINPEDLESVNTLQGAGAAALYGSQASNGAVIITTKKGRKGSNTVRLSNTTTVESVAYFPKLQTSFGGGGAGYGYDVNGNTAFSNLENQSYGPRFDGSQVALGLPLEDGSQLMVPYAPNNSRKEFWNKGLTNQTDFALSSGDDVSSFYVSGQYAAIKGTTPGDKSNRTTLRVNGTRKIGQKINVSYNTTYTQYRDDITTQTGSMYANMLNVPANVPLTSYSDWRNDKFSNPNGFYNPWYQNPYFSADNYRIKNRKDYLIANIEARYAPTKWLDLVARQGISTRNNSFKSTVGSFKYTPYAIESSGGSKSNIPASVSDGTGYITNLVSDLFLQARKNFGDFSVNFVGGGQWRQDESKVVAVGASGLVVPNLYNVGNLVGTPTVGEGNYKARQMGFYGDLRLGYKNYLFLHGTGRNDWVSTLAENNRSFFYPSADVSFVASEALPFIKESRTINYLKLRGGWSKVGQVNLGNSGDFGAYYLQQTFSQANGFPYASGAGFTVNNTLVSASLKPEITKGYEIGFEMNMFKDRITSSVTWYSTKTNDQTVTTGISGATGFANLRTNTGQTQSQGLELTLHGTPIRTRDWEVTIGGNYTYLDNKVNNISADLPRLALATYGDNTGSYAVEHQFFPVIMGFDYKRDPQGHVIVDGKTGNPLKDPTIKVLGNAVAKHRVGLDMNVTYKNFHFTALAEYRGGYKIYNRGGGEFDWSGSGIRTVGFNRTRFVVPNSVYEDPNKPGSYITNTNLTIQDGNDFWSDNDLNRSITSNYVTSGAFWKLREVAISYDLPATVIRSVKFIKSARVSVQGRNLLIFLPKSNVYTDPEYSEAGNDSNGIGITGLSSAPPSRFYGATLSLNF